MRLISILSSRWKAGGKPSTWFPPGGLVEQDGLDNQSLLTRFHPDLSTLTESNPLQAVPIYPVVCPSSPAPSLSPLSPPLPLPSLSPAPSLPLPIPLPLRPLAPVSCPPSLHLLPVSFPFPLISRKMFFFFLSLVP